MLTDIDIARKAYMEPITEIGEKLGITHDSLYCYGAYKAKLSHRFLESLEDRSEEGNLILVTAISPTPAGEGKTTTLIGLSDALSRLGKKTAACLREPSLGPCFGMKGGACGGGYAQVVPMEDINLHFTGDIHAIGVANNLLAALLDNHIHHGNRLDIDPRRISWRRVLDMNDRSLRNIVISLGGVGNGFPREDHFDITVASEVMAVLCLSKNLEDLRHNLDRMIVGRTRSLKAVTAEDLQAGGPMTSLLRDAFMPNLVQTLEHTPAFVHGGPFANIAHGCNSLVATKTALKLADYVVTEAGFGADLGALKFLDIKCRKSGIAPKVAVLVATIRALKMHGGVEKSALDKEDVEAVYRGGENLKRHIENLRRYQLPLVVAINQFSKDTLQEINAVYDICNSAGVDVVLCRHWEQGGVGCEELAQKVISLTESSSGHLSYAYAEDCSVYDKLDFIARNFYGADRISLTPKACRELKLIEKDGFASLPVCIAKTQYSFSTDPNLKGAPCGHEIQINEFRLSRGAGFVVAVCGDIMTMPGLSSSPAAHDIFVDEYGNIQGLF